VTSANKMKRQRDAAKHGHWPRPDLDRSHCRDCGLPIRKYSRYWVHKNRPGQGRRKNEPRNKHKARELGELWKTYNQVAAVHIALCDQLLAGMVREGMLMGHIAEVTGMPHGVIRYRLIQLGIVPPVMPKISGPPNSRAVLERLLAAPPAPEPRAPADPVLDRLAQL
jgi:hypothetical protein